MQSPLRDGRATNGGKRVDTLTLGFQLPQRAGGSSLGKMGVKSKTCKFTYQGDSATRVFKQRRAALHALNINASTMSCRLIHVVASGRISFLSWLGSMLCVQLHIRPVHSPVSGIQMLSLPGSCEYCSTWSPGSASGSRLHFLRLYIQKRIIRSFCF